MQTLIIDENYDGLTKNGYWYELESLEYDGNVEVLVPLEVCGSLEICGSLKVGEWLKVGKWLEVGEWLNVGEWLKVGKWLEVGKWLNVGEWLKVGKWLEVGKWLDVGESLNVGESLKVGEWLEVGKWLEVGEIKSINGVKTNVWQSLHLPYYVELMQDHIKIGCELHPVEHWHNLTESQAVEMDGKKALKFYREHLPFVLSVHKSMMETTQCKH